MLLIGNGAATSSFVIVSLRIGGWPGPDHNELAKGTLRALLHEAGLTIDDLRHML